jgi:hypothetical protein
VPVPIKALWHSVERTGSYPDSTQVVTVARRMALSSTSTRSQ